MSKKDKFRYLAWRDPKDNFQVDILVEERLQDGTDMGLPLKHIVYHSPTGMEWGYGGSGPADTALSILTDYIRRTKLRSSKRASIEMAKNFHMNFKWAFIAGADREGFSITDVQIRNWLNEQISKLNMNSE